MVHRPRFPFSSCLVSHIDAGVVEPHVVDAFPGVLAQVAVELVVLDADKRGGTAKKQTNKQKRKVRYTGDWVKLLRLPISAHKIKK